MAIIHIPKATEATRTYCGQQTNQIWNTAVLTKGTVECHGNWVCKSCLRLEADSRLTREQVYAAAKAKAEVKRKKQEERNADVLREINDPKETE